MTSVSIRRLGELGQSEAGSYNEGSRDERRGEERKGGRVGEQ